MLLATGLLLMIWLIVRLLRGRRKIKRVVYMEPKGDILLILMILE